MPWDNQCFGNRLEYRATPVAELGARHRLNIQGRLHLSCCWWMPGLLATETKAIIHPPRLSQIPPVYQPAIRHISERGCVSWTHVCFSPSVAQQPLHSQLSEYLVNCHGKSTPHHIWQRACCVAKRKVWQRARDHGMHSSYRMPYHPEAAGSNSMASWRFAPAPGWRRLPVKMGHCPSGRSIRPKPARSWCCPRGFWNQRQR